MRIPGGEKLPLAILMISAMVLAACSGDDGAAGPAGPAGAPGPQGPPGAGGGIPVSSAEKINVSIDSVSVPAGGGAPTVDLTLTNDLNQGLSGLPAANISFIIAQLTPGASGASSEWQSYTSRDSAGIANAQATTENGATGTFTDNGDGTYTYTFAEALTDYPAGPVFDESKTHRLGVEIRTSTGGFLPENIPANNAPHDFLPTGGLPTFTRLIVDSDTCNACHDNLELHGEARFDVEYCVQCHNPYSIDGDTVDEPWGGSVDMKVLVHKIHYGAELEHGYKVVGYGGSENDYSHVVFPQDVRNCQTCHEESDENTPQASNWRMVANRAACGTCHDDIDWDDGGHPGDLTFMDDTQCLDCHGPDASINGGEVQIARAHEIPTRLESEKFAFNILSISDTGIGEKPVIEFSVTDPTDNDAPYNVQTDEPFTTCAFGSSRLAIGVSWSTTDYTNTGSGGTPGQPVSMNPLTACGGTSDDLGGGVFSVTSPVAIPADAVGSAAITIDGHPAVDVDGTIERIAVTSAVAYAAITDADAASRRDIVNIDKCNDCHNQLSVHGNNRSDNVQVCATCHNPNATDINRRADACAADIGGDDVSIDFKRMVHSLHGYSFSGVPYEVCGFGNQAHVFDFVYPGRLNNCEGCHNPGTYYPVDPAAVLASTVDAGGDLASPDDDTAISPNTSVCSGCHASPIATQHMLQNGGDFSATKAADSSLISAGVETCELCHGPGRSADVRDVHGVGSFQIN